MHSNRAPMSPKRRAIITAALLTGTFLASIEVTVVGTAMPSITAQLGGIELYPWVFSAYLLAQTVTIPLYGRLTDLFGRRWTYVGGVLLFLALLHRSAQGRIRPTPGVSHAAIASLCGMPSCVIRLMALTAIIASLFCAPGFLARRAAMGGSPRVLRGGRTFDPTAC